MINKELAEQILEQIDKHPETHDQTQWGKKNECGTSACVAGWATILSGEQVWINDEDISSTTYLSGMAENYGRKALGIDFDTAFKLFYETTNAQAKEALKYLAKGEIPPWEEMGMV